MLALVNSANSEEINQMALSVAAGLLNEYGHPYEIFIQHELFTVFDPELEGVIGEPDGNAATVWQRAEEAALDVLPVCDEDTYLVWMGDN